MTKQCLSALIGLFGGIGLAHGDTVSVVWSGQVSGASIARSDGVELAPGNVVRLGVFDLSEADIEGGKSDVEFLEAHFTEVSREKIGTFGASIVLGGSGSSVVANGTDWGVAGGFAQQVSFDASTYAGGLEGRRFYIWASIPDSERGGEPPEQAIFSDSSWVLPPAAQAAYEWDVSQVEPDEAVDVYLATQGTGSEISEAIGGFVNKMLTIAVIDWLSDDDRDGVLRLLEEALGGDPGVADGALILPEQVEVEVDGVPVRALRYRRLAGGAGTTGVDYTRGGFRYRIQASDDLFAWSDLLAEEVRVVSTVPNSDGTETVTVAYLATDVPRQFLRLGVERLP